MDSDSKAIQVLIVKIQSGLPQIKYRSISTLHTKISVGLLPVEKLPIYVRMPGVLLQWINDNNAKSDHLFNVLTILSCFTKTEEGLVLLMEYQALEFFEQLRKYLLANQRNVQDFVDILNEMIKALLPLAKHHMSLEADISQDRSKASQISLKTQSKLNNNVDSNPKKEFQKDLVLKFVVCKQSLQKKEDQQLYSLLMELRHGKKQLQFSSLANILKLIKYWGYKSFRYKGELIKQLLQNALRGSHSWISYKSIFILLKQLRKKAHNIINDESFLVNLSKSKLQNTDNEAVILELKRQNFEHIYCYRIIEEIISYLQILKNGDQYLNILEWLLYLPYKFTPKYFIIILKKVLKEQKFNINKKQLNSQIKLYISLFPQMQQQIIEIFLNIKQQNKLINPDDLPQLKKYLLHTQHRRSFEFIKKYVDDFQINKQLHRFAEMLDNLQKGIKGIVFNNKTHINIKIYMNVLLVVGVATAKQDPLMSHYPQVKQIFKALSIQADLTTALYEQLLSASNSFQTFTYLSKIYVVSQIMLMILSDIQFFDQLFKQSFVKEITLTLFLEIAKRIILTQSGFTGLKKFVTLLYCLRYHKNKPIASLSNLLLDKMPKKYKLKLLLLKLFSNQQQQRSLMCIEFGGQNANLLMKQLLNQTKSNQPPRKALKVDSQTIDNYIKIVFNSSLEINVRLSCASQFLQILERIQLNAVIQQRLIRFSADLVNLISSQDVYLSLLSSIFRLYCTIKNVIKNQASKLKEEVLIYLLRIIQHRQTLRLVLQQIYVICFQNPFTIDRQKHYSSLLYPHFQLVHLQISLQPVIQQISVLSAHQKDSHSQLQNITSAKDYRQYVQVLLIDLLNSRPVKLDQFFTQLVQKQIAQALLAAKSHDCLYFLAHSLLMFRQFKLCWPQKLCQHSPHLLNSLLAKQQSLLHSEAVSSILSSIGFRKTKQVYSILFQFLQKGNQWRYKLILELQLLQVTNLQIIMKRLLGLSCQKQCLMILKVVDKFAKFQQLSQYSLTLLIASLTKCFKQDIDAQLRRYSLSLLFKIFSKQQNHALFGQDINVVGSLASQLTQSSLPIQIVCLSLEVISLFVLYSQQFEDHHIIKFILGKLAPLLYESPLPKSIILSASTFSFINAILTKNMLICVQELDLTDCSIAIWATLLDRSKQCLSIQAIHLLLSISQFLYLWSNVESDLDKYLLSSTNLLVLLIKTFKFDIQYLSAPLVENLSTLLHYLSLQEDLFVYKLSHLTFAQTQHQKIFPIFQKHLGKGKDQFLKMLSWFIVIWSKQRSILDQKNLGQKMAEAYLKSENPYLIKSLIAFSWQAKMVFLSSTYLQQLLKQGSSVIQNKIIVQIKESKKKKIKHQLQQTVLSQQPSSDNNKLENIMSLLTALFHDNDEINQISLQNGRQPIKKVIIFIQKLYTVSLSQSKLAKPLIKLITNFVQCKPFSSFFTTRFIDSNSMILEDIIGNILKSENLTSSSKVSFCLLSVLAHYQPVRSYILKAHLLQQLNSRICRIEDPKIQLNLHYIYQIVNLYIVLSLYKETNVKLINDKRVLDSLLTYIKMQKFAMLDQKIVLLLSNIVCFKHNKTIVMSDHTIHKMIMWLMQKQDFSSKDSLLTFIYNLSYKNSAAIKLYRKSQVISLLRSVQPSTKYKIVHHSLMEALQLYQCA